MIVLSVDLLKQFFIGFFLQNVSDPLFTVLTEAQIVLETQINQTFSPFAEVDHFWGLVSHYCVEHSVIRT